MTTAADPSAWLEDVLARVAAARPSDGCNAAVTDADVRTLSALSPEAREDAVIKLAKHGAGMRVLRDRIKRIVARAGFSGPRPVGAEDDWLANLRRKTDPPFDPMSTVDNALAIFRQAYAGRLSYDVKALLPCLDGDSLDDDGMTMLRGAVGARFKCTLQVGDFRAAVLAVAAEQKKFSPVAEYLRGLTHDEVPRLATMARDHLGLEDAYSNLVLRKVLIGAVARGFVDQETPFGVWAPHGFMVKTVPILLGWQNQKKSTFWHTIFTPRGRPWFGCSKVDVEKRQAPITLAAKWGYEFPEIDGWLSRHSTEAAKAWSAQPDDDFVRPYGASNFTQPRSFFVVGTTNKEKFLTDATGSSRWLVLDIRQNGKRWKVDVTKLRAALDQLWAEAVVEFYAYLMLREEGVEDDDNPYRWWLNEDEDDQRARRNEGHTVENGWSGVLGAWLSGAEVTCATCRGSGGHSGGCPPCAGSGRVTRGQLPVDDLGREYVTVDTLLADVLGIPTERWPRTRGDVIDALGRIGWRAGASLLPKMHNGRKSRSRVTPFYLEDSAAAPTVDEVLAEVEAVEESGGAFAELDRRRARLAAELDAVDAAVEQLATRGAGAGATFAAEGSPGEAGA